MIKSEDMSPNRPKKLKNGGKDCNGITVVIRIFHISTLYKESWAPKNWCFWTVVLEKALESPLDCKEVQPISPKGNQSWIFTGRTDVETNTLATWCEELTHPKRPWCWERLKAEREGDTRGWDGLMASPTWWTWILVSSGSWWWTRRPGVLQSMGSQRVGHDWTTELTELNKLNISTLVLFKPIYVSPWWGWRHQCLLDKHTFLEVQNFDIVDSRLFWILNPQCFPQCRWARGTFSETWVNFLPFPHSSPSLFASLLFTALSHS